MLAWLSVWSEVETCISPNWCHCHSLSLVPVKSRLVLPFWYRLTWVVLDKGPLNGCVCDDDKFNAAVDVSNDYHIAGGRWRKMCWCYCVQTRPTQGLHASWLHRYVGCRSWIPQARNWLVHIFHSSILLCVSSPVVEMIAWKQSSSYIHTPL